VEGAPLQSAYTVVVDANWRMRHVAVHVETPHTVADLVLTADGTGMWWRDGEALPSVGGCLDADLGITPATNTLPIRRLQRRPGDGADIGVVWVAFPKLRIARRDQRYDRLSMSRYRYHSGTYTAELIVDEQGLVRNYEGAWRVIAQG
jgi:hypothetical protein